MLPDSNNEWFFISNADEIDSPALVVYPERIKENVRLLISRVKNITSLRPHVKTHKMAEVCRIMMQQGITKFKCATIAEAEMLGQAQAPDVLMAYQPVGPKVQRFILLVKTFPVTIFSCLVDNMQSATAISNSCAENNIVCNVFLDLNVGMNRTGIHPDKGLELFIHCLNLPGISPVGLHGYDGHANDTDMALRQQKSDKGFGKVHALANEIISRFHLHPVIVAGGSPSFPTHVGREQVEFSPGTFIFWDWGYSNSLPDEPYLFAALVLSRVISIVDQHTVCTDLGHKSVAAENPLPRVHFLNAPGAIPVSQSEEHLVLQVPDAGDYAVGDVLYGVPVHICPTVALHNKAVVIEKNKATAEWQVIARNRKITI